MATTIITCLLRYGIAGSKMKLDNQFNIKVVKNMAELMQIHLEFRTSNNEPSLEYDDYVRIKLENAE